MKKLFSEFKEFIARGNVLDMAVGVILATAFGKITTTLVANILTPLIAFLFNSKSADALNLVLREPVKDASGEIVEAGIVLEFGTLLGAIIDFILVALVVFLIVKAFNKARALAEKKKKEEEAAAAEEEEKKPTTEELLGEILEEIRKK